VYIYGEYNHRAKQPKDPSAASVGRLARRQYRRQPSQARASGAQA